MFKSKVTVFIFVIFCYTKVYSQEFLLHSDFHQILDNREYFLKYGHPQTILGSRLNIITGLQLDSINSFHAGVNYMYEYGGDIDEVPLQVNLFYKYQTKHVLAYFGAFPRKDLLNYPLALLTDTLNYYRPNIEGGFFQFSGSWGNINAWCDWTGRQTQVRRESFMAGLSGRLKYRFLYFDYYAYMFHFAADATRSQHIRDNGAEAAFLGVDLSFLSKHLKKLSFDAGAVGSYDRVRPSPYVHYAGFMSRIHIHFNRFGVDATIYSGDKHHLAYGDALYTSGRYNRVDLFIVPFKTPYVDSRFSFNLHFIKGELNTSQQLSIIAYFDIKRKIKLPQSND